MCAKCAKGLELLLDLGEGLAGGLSAPLDKGVDLVEGEDVKLPDGGKKVDVEIAGVDVGNLLAGDVDGAQEDSVDGGGVQEVSQPPVLSKQVSKPAVLFLALVLEIEILAPFGAILTATENWAPFFLMMIPGTLLATPPSTSRYRSWYFTGGRIPGREMLARTESQSGPRSMITACPR